MEVPESEILSRAVAGDRQALGNLLARNTPDLRRHLAGRVPPRWRSLLSEDDVVQQTLADAARWITRIEADDDRSFACWLAKTADRNLTDAVRMLEADKRGGDWHYVDGSSSGATWSDLFGRLPATQPTPTREARRREAEAAVGSALESLPKPYARVIQMFYLEGKPVEEIAAVLGRSPGAVYMLRQRALERLHELLGETGKFFTTFS